MVMSHRERLRGLSRMDTLLRIDTSVRAQASHSRAVADRLQACWCDAHPRGRVIVRDLALAPPPHLDARTLAAFWGEATASAEVSDALIAELRQATDLLISTPLYNFGIPSTLKAWIDQVVRSGHTFELRDGVHEPLLRGRTAYVAAARGALPGGANTEDYRLPHLRTALRFLGWPCVEMIEVVGTSIPEAEPGARLAAALAAAEALFKTVLMSNSSE